MFDNATTWHLANSGIRLNLEEDEEIPNANLGIIFEQRVEQDKSQCLYQ